MESITYNHVTNPSEAKLYYSNVNIADFKKKLTFKMDYQHFLNFSNDELSNIINDYGMAKNTNLSTDNSMRILVKYMTERSYPRFGKNGKGSN